MGSPPMPPPPAGPGQPPSDVAPWVAPYPMATGVPEPSSPRRRMGLWIGAGVLVVAAVVVVVALAIGGGGSKLHLPATLGGQPRLTSEIAKGLAEGMRSEVVKHGGPAPSIAIYGPASAPKYILMEFNRSIKKDYPSLQDAMRDVGSGIAPADGALVLTQAVYDTRSGAEYGCAPLQSSSATVGALCVWDDGTTTGFAVLIAVTDLQGALKTTQEAHDASVS